MQGAAHGGHLLVRALRMHGLVGIAHGADTRHDLRLSQQAPLLLLLLLLPPWPPAKVSPAVAVAAASRRSDPMAVLLVHQGASGWKEVGRTEVVSNNESPTFVKVQRGWQHLTVPICGIGEGDPVCRCWRARCLSPFTVFYLQKFKLLYNFEAVQSCRLEIVDVDKAHKPDTVDFRKCVSVSSHPMCKPCLGCDPGLELSAPVMLLHSSLYCSMYC